MAFNEVVDLSGTQVTSVLTVANGGTGRSSLTNHGILVGATTGAITQLGAGSAGQLLTSNGAGSDPSYTTATFPADRKSTRLNSSHIQKSRMPSSA